MKKRKKVAIIYRFLPHYRETFYRKLRSELIKNDVDLDLFYGDGDGIERKKDDKIDIDWAQKKPNLILPFFNKYFLYQPFLFKSLKYDLIIVEQANKLILNYVLLILKNLIPSLNIAFWGHGIDFQSKKANSLNNQAKKLFITFPDYWFAYNNKTVNLLKDNKFPENKISNVENTIDTDQLKSQLLCITDKDIIKFNKKYKIKSKYKLLFIGGMYENKRIDFIIDVSIKLNDMGLDFTTIFVGSGPDSKLVHNHSGNKDYIKYSGPLFGVEKATILKQADCILMPGLVGLVVIDSFVSQSPIITTDFPHHSPEVDYIENNINGFILDEGVDVEEYSQFVHNYLLDESLQNFIKINCNKSGEYFTIDNMVSNFKNGIVEAIK